MWRWAQASVLRYINFEKHKYHKLQFMFLADGGRSLQRAARRGLAATVAYGLL